LLIGNNEETSMPKETCPNCGAILDVREDVSDGTAVIYIECPDCPYSRVEYAT